MKQYCTIRLKSKEFAVIVEILEDGKAYIADVDHSDGSTTTEFITQEQIDDVIK